LSFYNRNQNKILLNKEKVKQYSDDEINQLYLDDEGNSTTNESDVDISIESKKQFEARNETEKILSVLDTLNEFKNKASLDFPDLGLFD